MEVVRFYMKSTIPPKNKVYATNNSIPGSVIYTGKKSITTSIHVLNYNQKKCIENNYNSVEKIFDTNIENGVNWIHFNGLANTEAIITIGEHYKLHNLVLEDVVNTTQRAKLEEFEDYIFIVCKILHINANNELIFDHMSMIVGSNYVITFLDHEDAVFDNLIARIKNATGRVRSSKSDYLMFAILDAVVDNYFTVSESVEDKVEDVEASLFVKIDENNKTTAANIQELKQGILQIRRAIFPFRDVTSKLLHSNNSFILPKTKNYIRSLHEHMLQIVENIDLSREMTWGLMDLYMTNISNNMNQIMKVLTIMSTIFIPLSFIVGLYGMNFTNMPELQYKYGYFIILGIILLIVIIMLRYFKKKNWI